MEAGGGSLMCASRTDGAASAFYSNDFDWETLRAETENSRPPECETDGPKVDIGARDSDEEAGTPTYSTHAWEIFHRKHCKHLFFKERRYLVKEFPELGLGGEGTRILEVGCGSGSSLVPVLRANTNATVYGCDCSTSALERAKQLVETQAGLDENQIQSFKSFQCDISKEAFPAWLSCPGIDIVMLIFTLSAIPLESMCHALRECASILQPGGCLLFRDYGLYDMTMLRFPSSQKIAKGLYFRKDGTLSYFFSLEFVRELFTSAGLVEEELHYCCVQIVNRRKQVSMKRVWVHAKFRKPEVPMSSPL